MFPKPLTHMIIYSPKESIRKVLLNLANNCYVQLNSSFDDKLVAENSKPIQPSSLLARALNLLQHMENSVKDKPVPNIELDEKLINLSEEDINYIEKLDEESRKGTVNWDEYMKAYVRLKAFCNLESTLEKIAETDKIAVIDIWAKTVEVEKVIDSVKQVEDKAAFEIVEEKREHGETESPTLLERTRMPQVFRRLVLAFGTPKANELEPSAFMVVTYPIIFALMFGDFGHGLLLTIFGVYLLLLQKRNIKFGETLSLIVSGAKLYIILGITSSIVGLFMYREAFGSHELAQTIYETLHLPEIPENLVIGVTYIPLRLNPIETPLRLARLSLLIAFFQVSFGIILSMINAINTRRVWKVVGDIGWVTLYLSIAYLFFIHGRNVISAILNFNTILFTILPPLAVMVLGRIVEEKVNGLLETMEQVISLISNTFSYFRILAIGAAHALFSKLIFDAGNTLNILLFIPILAFGTIIIMGFEGLLAFLHCLRLHWVEWFMKFYSGTGRTFQPLKLV
ncbi:MAG: V-type ATPase 116kDa subunit family protein [Nitrososphaeria archaeon]